MSDELPKCKSCGSEKLDFLKSWFVVSPKNNITFLVNRYKCKDCGKAQNKYSRE